MAGFDDLGAALAGNASGNALSYAKGLSLGANTEVALATARDRAQKNAALDKLESTMGGFGITDPAQQAAFATSARAGIDPGQFPGARLKMQEADTRNRIATDPAVNDTVMQRLLSSLANGPVQTYESAGEGMVTNRLHPEKGVVTTPLGDALVGQRNAAAALDNEKRTNPAAFRSAGGVPGGGKVFDMGGGVKGVLTGYDADGNPIVKPLTNAAGVAENTNTVNAGKALTKAQAAAQTALPGVMNDIDNMRANITDLLHKPGFDGIYGLRGAIYNVPGTDAANAAALREQVSSQSFQVSIQKMRGLGALSDAEGKKVQSAFTAAAAPGLSAAEARTRWNTALASLDNLEKIARQEAGGDFDPLAADARAPGTTAPAAAPQAFATETEAEAAGIKPGTRVTIGGVPGTWQ